MFLSLLYRHTSLGVWASHVCFRPYFHRVQSRGEMNLVVLKTVFTESHGKQAHSRILKSESLEGKVLALVFYNSTPDSMV